MVIEARPITAITLFFYIFNTILRKKRDIVCNFDPIKAFDTYLKAKAIIDSDILLPCEYVYLRVLT